MTPENEKYIPPSSLYGIDAVTLVQRLIRVYEAVGIDTEKLKLAIEMCAWD